MSLGLTTRTLVGRVARRSVPCGGVQSFRVVRMDGRPTTTSQHGRSGLLAALLTLALLSGVPETLASGELRAEAQGKAERNAGVNKAEGGAKKTRGVAE